jgi:DNA-binding transcriptional MerR regulator
MHSEPVPQLSDFRAADVLALAGLSYRQLHYWEQAGIIDSERVSSEGWRKFTLDEVVALAICSRLRDHFFLPLDQAGNVYEWLISKPRNRGRESQDKLNEIKSEVMKLNPTLGAHMNDDYPDLSKREPDFTFRPKEKNGPRFDVWIKRYATIEIQKNCRPSGAALKMAQAGFGVYLITDLKSFRILGDDELVQWISNLTVAEPMIVFPLNDILNKILTVKRMPQFELDQYLTTFRSYWHDAERAANLTAQEREIIRLIRERRYKSITAHIKDGQLVRLETEEELPAKDRVKSEEAILEAVRSGNHQTITVVKGDGKIVRLVRKASIKLDRVTGKH